MTCFSRAGLARVGLAWALLASGIVLAPLPAGAQDYPARDIRAISAFPANTDADLLVRYYSEKLSALANRPVTVDNRAGSNGVVGTEAAAKSKADGYTILSCPATRRWRRHPACTRSRVSRRRTSPA